MHKSRLDAAGDPELRRALLAVRASAAPVTADDLAAELGVHRNVARARLERLVETGALEPGYERRTGRSGPGAGRPAKTYAVAPELEAVEFPARRWETLIGLLLDALPSEGEDVGAAFGRELAAAAAIEHAGALPEAAEHVCAAVRRLGYQASVVEASATNALLRTPTCPLRPLVAARPEAAGLDCGMWAGLMASSLEGVDASAVGCRGEHCLDDHAACRVRIEL
jgi:predicted ArsR family transcriptional regulator